MKRWRLWAALFGAVLPGAMLVTASPLLNAVSMQLRDLDPLQIGLIRTSEILLNASLTIYLSTQLARLSPREVGLIGALLTLVGNLAALPGDGFWDLWVARLIAGAGMGCLAAAGAAIYARIESPQRVAGVLLIPWTMGSVIAALVAGQAAKAGAPIGVFGVLAAAGAVAALALMAAPNAPLAKPAAPLQTAGLSQLFATLGNPFAIGVMVMYFGSTASWHFFAGMGAAQGIAPNQIGGLIAVVGVAGAIVTGLGAVLMRDAWVRRAALAAIGAFALATITLPIAGSAVLFVAAYALQSMSYVLTSVMLPALGLRLERTGALNAASQGLQAFANAFAPAIGGLLVLGGAYWPLSFLNAACTLFAFAAIYLATRTAQPMIAQRPD
jgi:predicted MFS family arabinose efflux permease